MFALIGKRADYSVLVVSLMLTLGGAAYVGSLAESPNWHIAAALAIGAALSGGLFAIVRAGHAPGTRQANELDRAQQALAKHMERLRILHEIDQALITEQPPEAIAAAALRPLRELLGVPRAIINIFDLAAGEVEWLAAAGRRRMHVGPGVRYSMRLMGDVDALRRGEPQIIDTYARWHP